MLKKTRVVGTDRQIHQAGFAHRVHDANRLRVLPDAERAGSIDDAVLTVAGDRPGGDGNGADLLRRDRGACPRGRRGPRGRGQGETWEVSRCAANKVPTTTTAPKGNSIRTRSIGPSLSGHVPRQGRVNMAKVAVVGCARPHDDIGTPRASEWMREVFRAARLISRCCRRCG